jgi:hypothetical protein
MRCVLGSLSFAGNLCIIPLQAADYVAYETCKLATDLNLSIKRFRASLKSFLKRARYDCILPEEEGLKTMLDRYNQMRSQL